jgi:hypothetical protein
MEANSAAKPGQHLDPLVVGSASVISVDSRRAKEPASLRA